MISRHKLYHFTVANLVLPPRVRNVRLGGIVNFALPFTTNEINSISTSQTFRSWVVLFHLHRPMAFYLSDIRYAWACSSYKCFILRARRLSSKLLKQGYLVEQLNSSFRKFYGRYRDLIQQYEVSLSRMSNEILTLDQWQWLYNRSDIHPISWPWYRDRPSPNHEWFATGVASQQGTLTLPDTCQLFRPPFWDLLLLQLLRPVLPN